MSKPKPPEPLVRRTVTLPESLWREVAEFRLTEHIGSDMETMRQLVKAGLRSMRPRPSPQVAADSGRPSAADAAA